MGSLCNLSEIWLRNEHLGFAVADSIKFIAQLPNLQSLVCLKVLDGDREPQTQHPSLIKAWEERSLLQQQRTPKLIPFYERLVVIESAITAV
jgi:hypothetical protein